MCCQSASVVLCCSCRIPSPFPSAYFSVLFCFWMFLMVLFLSKFSWERLCGIVCICVFHQPIWFRYTCSLAFCIHVYVLHLTCILHWMVNVDWLSHMIACFVFDSINFLFYFKPYDFIFVMWLSLLILGCLSLSCIWIFCQEFDVSKFYFVIWFRPWLFNIIGWFILQTFFTIFGVLPLWNKISVSVECNDCP